MNIGYSVDEPLAAVDTIIDEPECSQENVSSTHSCLRRSNVLEEIEWEWGPASPPRLPVSIATSWCLELNLGSFNNQLFSTFAGEYFERIFYNYISSGIYVI